MKIYILTDYAKENGVLELTTNKREGINLFNWYKNDKNWDKSELYLIQITYDGRIYDYDFDYYKIQFHMKNEKREIDKTKLRNRIERKTILSNKQ